MAHQSNDRPLSPAETARRFGVSIKALRLYELRGLLKPVRSGNGRGPGWRAYGPDQIARLHQILALKALGLSLARIGALLQGPDRLESVLAVQEQALARQSAQLARALGLVRTARAKCAGGVALSIDDLATLTKETVMTVRPDPEEMKTLFQQLGEKHFTAEERDRIARRKYEQPEIGAAWDSLIPEAKALMAKGDPASPEMLDVARRWRDLVRQFTGGDPALTEKLRAVWTDALADPRTASHTPLTPELMSFMRTAITHLPD